jgi:hypothetical protein
MFMMRISVALILLVTSTAIYAQEHARILSQSTIYTIHENETAEIEENYKIEILAEGGYRYSVYQEYLDKFHKVTDITIDIFDQHGKKVKRLRKSDGVEFSFNQSNEISDGKIFYIDPDYKQYPYTIEVKSKVRLDGFLSLPTWIPRFQFNLSVTQSSLTVIRPASLKIKFKEEHITGNSETVENNIITKYQVSNLAHVDKKIRYQDFYNDQPKVFISPESFNLEDVPGSNASWAEFGNWFFTLNNEPYKLGKKTTDHLDSLDKSNKKVLIQNIYEYMQDKTRYVSIQLGIGGFKSLPTEDVDNSGYGDCKALTTYMKSMLDYAGVKSNYILVRAGRDVPDVMGDFPSNQFNHVFLGVPFPQDTLFLECTSQISPTGYTGSFTDDRNVLWIEKDKSSILRSTVYNHIDNTQTNQINIKLDTAGNATADFEISNQGIFFDEIMIFKSAPQDYLKNYNQSKFHYDDFTVKKFTYEQPSRNTPAFNSQYSLQINGLAKQVNDKLVLSMVPAKPLNDYVDKDNLMKFYSIKRGITVMDEISVNLPQNYWIYNLPEPAYINSPYGSYRLATEVSGNKLIIKRTIQLYKGDYSKADYEAFKVFFQSLEKLEKRKLVLNSKT